MERLLLTKCSYQDLGQQHSGWRVLALGRTRFSYTFIHLVCIHEIWLPYLILTSFAPLGIHSLLFFTLL